MPYFALTYDVVDDFVNKRTPFRPSHLKEVREAHARGELVMAGALGEPAGALLVFRAADKIDRREFREGRSLREGRPRQELEGPSLDRRRRPGSVRDAAGTSDLTA